MGSCFFPEVSTALYLCGNKLCWPDMLAFLLPWNKPKDSKPTLGKRWGDTDPLTEKTEQMGSRTGHCEGYDMAGRCCLRSAPSEHAEENTQKHRAFLAKPEAAECG